MKTLYTASIALMTLLACLSQPTLGLPIEHPDQNIQKIFKNAKEMRNELSIILNDLDEEQDNARYAFEFVPIENEAQLQNTYTKLTLEAQIVEHIRDQVRTGNFNLKFCFDDVLHRGDIEHQRLSKKMCKEALESRKILSHLLNKNSDIEIIVGLYRDEYNVVKADLYSRINQDKLSGILEAERKVVEKQIEELEMNIKKFESTKS